MRQSSAWTSDDAETVAAVMDANKQPEPLENLAPAVAPLPFVPKSPLLTAAYVISGTLIALIQGLGISFVSTSLPPIAGSIGLTTVEATWLMAAYVFPTQA